MRRACQQKNPLDTNGDMMLRREATHVETKKQGDRHSQWRNVTPHYSGEIDLMFFVLSFPTSNGVIILSSMDERFIHTHAKTLTSLPFNLTALFFFYFPFSRYSQLNPMREMRPSPST